MSDDWDYSKGWKYVKLCTACKGEGTVGFKKIGKNYKCIPCDKCDGKGRFYKTPPDRFGVMD